MAKEALPETILKITVTASGTEGMNRDEHARAGYVAVGNGVAEADVEVLPRANVADGGEPGHERDTRVDTGVEGPFGNGFLQVFQFFPIVVVRIREGEVRVSVDETGRSVASPRSITSAPAGIAAAWPTAAMRPPVTTTSPGVTNVSLLPSNMAAAFRTYVLSGGFCPCP